MASYSTILFDLDGTLTDPKVGITKSVQYALAKLGIHEPDSEKLTAFIGPPLHHTFQERYHLHSSEAQQAVAYYREYFKTEGMYENILYQGVRELLTALKEHERTVALATSKPTVFAGQILNYFGIGQFFDLVVGSNLDGTRSDKTEVVLYALRQCDNLPKSEFVMIGDRDYDIIGANGNGIESIGVTYGYGSREELVRAKATYIVDAVGDLYELLLQ